MSKIIADTLENFGTDPIVMNNMLPGSILSVNVIRNNVRTAVGLSPSTILVSGTIKKLRSDTVIRATCTVFGDAFQSGNCGVGMRCNGIWDHGVAYQYDGAWGAFQTTIVFGTSEWSNISAGNTIIEWGWRSLTGSAERPFQNINPNNQVPSEPRNQQMISSIVVYEVYP